MGFPLPCFMTESARCVDVLYCPKESFHKMDDMLRDPAFAKAGQCQGCSWTRGKMIKLMKCPLVH